MSNPALSLGLDLLDQSGASSTVLSPISIALALSLVREGSEGNTKTQIDNVLYKGLKGDGFYSTASKQLGDSQKVNVSLANRLFADEQFPILPAYQKTVQDKFAAKVDVLQFAKKDAAAKIVNDFVSSVTHGKIENIVTPDQFEGAAAFIINALYFEADWQTPFNTHNIQQTNFFTSGKTKKMVPMMVETIFPCKYATSDEAMMVQLNYTDEKYGMYIVLPTARFGLSKLKSSFDAAAFTSLKHKLSFERIDIKLPKFSITHELDLKAALGKLGVSDIFSDSAKLTHITQKALKISDALHKATIDVTEKGTVAAAVSAMRAVPMSLREYPHFFADHPFLFVVARGDIPLFIGQYYGA